MEQLQNKVDGHRQWVLITGVKDEMHKKMDESKNVRDMFAV